MMRWELFGGTICPYSEQLLKGRRTWISLLFLADITISTTTLVKIRVHAGKLDGDSTEKITNEVRSVLAEKSALVRRMMRAFPEARLYNGKIIMIMRERRLQLRKEIKQAKKKTKQRIQMTER